MLKIKDNVKLEWLKNFGFEDYNETCYAKEIYVSKDYNNCTLEILVYKKDTTYAKKNTIHLFLCIAFEEISFVDDLIAFDVLFDLFEAGFIEKVEE